MFTESRFVEAGYFYLTYKKARLTMELIQLPKANKTEEKNRIIWKTMEQIQMFQPEGILLYTSKENAELILQQVRQVLRIFKTQ